MKSIILLTPKITKIWILKSIRANNKMLNNKLFRKNNSSKEAIRKQFMKESKVKGQTLLINKSMTLI